MFGRALIVGALLLAGTVHGRAAEPPLFAGNLHGAAYLGDLPTLVADRLGLFRSRGLDLTVSYGRSGRDNLAALRSGEADFILSALTPLLLDRFADPTPDGPDDPVILANLTHSTDLNHVIAIDLKEVGDLRNSGELRVGLMKGANAEFIWSVFAAYHDLAIDRHEVTNVPLDGLGDALDKGSVDVVVAWEPWTRRLRQRFAERLAVFEASRVYTAKWVLVARRSMVDQSLPVLRALLSAYADAVQFIEKHPEQAVAFYVDRAGFGSAGLQGGRDVLLYDLSLDWSIVSGMMQQADWARRQGYVSGTSTGDPLHMLAPEPLRSLYPTSVRLPDIRPRGMETGR